MSKTADRGNRVKEMIDLAMKEGRKTIQKIQAVDKRTDKAVRETEREAFRARILANQCMQSPSRLSKTHEVDPKKMPLLIGDDIANIGRGLGYTCQVIKGVGQDERFLFFSPPNVKHPVIMVHVDLEKCKDDLQTYMNLNIEIRDFRYQKRSVRFSEAVLRSVLARELYTQIPDINMADSKEFPLVSTRMTSDTYKGHEFEAFHITLFLECYPPLEQVEIKNLSVTVTTIARMMFNALPGFNGHRKPDGPRTYDWTPASDDTPVVVAMPIDGYPDDDTPVVVAMPIDGYPDDDTPVVVVVPIGGYPGDDIPVVEAMPCEP